MNDERTSGESVDPQWVASGQGLRATDPPTDFGSQMAGRQSRGASVMGCGARFLITLAAIVALLGVPATVHGVEVYRSPFIPVPPPEPTAGTVVISTSVFDGLAWATDQTIVLADPTLTVDCGEQPAGGA